MDQENVEPFSRDLLIRFAPHRDTLVLTVGEAGCEGRGSGVEALSPFHRVEPRPWYLLVAENQGETVRVAELRVTETAGLPDDAPRFSPDWTEWRMPPAQSADAPGVDALSTDCRVLHLLLLPGQRREIALELLPPCRGAHPGEYLFSVGGQEVMASGQAGEEPGDRPAPPVAAQLLPAVGCLRLSYPEGRLLALLPEVYREAAREERRQTADDTPSFFERFLLGFGEIEEAMDKDIGLLPDLFGVDTAPQEWLRWLAAWVGLTLDDRWPEMRRRELIRNAIPLYRRRGTVRGLSDYLELFTGVRPQISDMPVEGMRLGPSARLGSPGAWLGHIAPHTFIVTLSPGRATLSDPSAASETDTAFVWDAVTVATLHDIIAASKPAHTAYELRILQDGATPVSVQAVPEKEPAP